MHSGKVVEFKNRRGEIVGRVGPRYLEPEEAAELHRQAGHTGWDLVVAVAVEQEESRLSPDAEGDLLIQSNEWGPSIGCMQVRSRKAEFGKGSLRDAKRLKDPVDNHRVAYEIFQGSGWRAWGAYSSGRYKQHLPMAERAVTSLGEAVDESAGRDWFDLATEEDVRRVVREELAAALAKDTIAKEGGVKWTSKGLLLNLKRDTAQLLKNSSLPAHSRAIPKK